MRAALVLTAASLALYPSRPAHACTQPPCWSAAFVPGDQGKLPANAPGLFWRPMSGPLASADPRSVVLTRADAPKVPIDFTAQPLSGGDYLLIPTTPLEVGGYVLVDRNTCSLTEERGPQIEFTVVPPAPLPPDLGALIAAKPSITQLDLETRTGSCSSPATVNEISFELVPSAAANAWLDALHFETLVDGQPWGYQTSLDVRVPPGASPRGRGRDRVFAVCASDDKSLVGLHPGSHVITMRATLPGTRDVMVSSALNVMLRCEPDEGPVTVSSPEPPGDESDGGCSAGGSSAAPAMLALLALLRARRRLQYR